jgi:hypothetical protein
MKIVSSLVLALGILACGGGSTSPTADDPGTADLALPPDVLEEAIVPDTGSDRAPDPAPDPASDPAPDPEPDPAPDAAFDPAPDPAPDPGKDTPKDVPPPVCLAPVLPESCLKEALTCTGLPTCGPTVTGCFQYGSEEFPQATWLISDWLTAQTPAATTYSASNNTTRVEYSNGAVTIGEFFPRPRALYFAPEGGLCAVLDFHYEENSDNWGDPQVARRYYLRYGDGKVIVIRPRFEASPGSWWRITDFDVTCADGKTEKLDWTAFQPFAYLLFGGENRDGKSFLPYWTQDGCELGEFKKECVFQEDKEHRTWCEGNTLNVCSRGVSLKVDCGAHQESCAQVPVKYFGSSEVVYYHSFCSAGKPCFADTCDGTKANECWGSSAETKDCADLGATCILLDQYSPAHAMCAQAPAVPCVQEGYQNRCDGDLAVRCDYYGYEYRLDCPALGRKCALGVDWDGNPYPYCVPPGTLQQCDATFTAKCEGDVRKVCSGGLVVTEDCKARYGKTCKVGKTGAGCVDPDSTPCVNTPNDCMGCTGDLRTACGANGLTVFDDCTRQGLVPTQGKGRTCAGETGAGVCGICAQEGAAPCVHDTFKQECLGEFVLACIAGHAVEWECSELNFTYLSGWCNHDAQGSAYCEAATTKPCDPATTPSKCEGLTKVNCTGAKVLEKVSCLDWKLPECRLNADSKAVCVQAGAQACDQSYTTHCEGETIASCNEGFTFMTPCPAGYECDPNGDDVIVCHQAGAATCNWYDFKYACEGNVAVSCQEGFVRKTDCTNACAMCQCHVEAMQAWCQPSF